MTCWRGFDRKRISPRVRPDRQLCALYRPFNGKIVFSESGRLASRRRRKLMPAVGTKPPFDETALHGGFWRRTCRSVSDPILVVRL
jgi:hypothetical protein